MYLTKKRKLKKKKFKKKKTDLTKKIFLIIKRWIQKEEKIKDAK